MSAIAKIPTLLQGLVKSATPKLKIIQRYAVVELVPPSIKDIPQIKSGISKLIHSAKTGGYKNLTVKEASLNTLVAIEVYCWFFIGECIGKRHLVGYDA